MTGPDSSSTESATMRAIPRRSPPTRPEALVTDAQLRSVVAGLRGLGRAGVGVRALSSRRAGAGRWSRHAVSRGLVPEVLHDPAGFVRAVAASARGVVDAGGPAPVVYPGREESVDALLEHAGVLTGVARLPYGDPAAVERLRDKRGLEELADEAGLSAPPTIMAATAGELRDSDATLTPSAIKPAYPGGVLMSTRLLETPEELHEILKDLPSGEPLLVQKRADGKLRAIGLVVDHDGSVVARVQQVALRTWPMEAGASRLAVTVAPDEELIRRCATLLTKAGYAGFAQMQFVEVDGRAALIDVNPRFYGSLPLALAAGVNLPAAWHAVVCDRPRPAPGRYRVGVSFRWLEADLTAAMRDGEIRPLLRRAAAPRIGAMWAKDDPVPAALLAADAISMRLARRLPGVGAAS